jgi:hypothetical protein
MKKNSGLRAEEWEMRKEYDFSNARPNKYAKKYAEGANIVVIEPDLVKFFPDSESVNAALRALVSNFPQSKPKRKPKGSLAA